jgi:hypothetical protein
MKKLLVVVLFSAIAMSHGFNAYPQTQTEFNLGYVNDLAVGCGCLFALNQMDFRKRRFVFVQDMGEPAYINLNGKNQKLTEVDSNKTSVKPEDYQAPQVGSRYWETYKSGDIQLRLNKVVTRVCKPNDDSCEATYYKATMTITRNKQKRTVNLTGVCGC